MTGYLGLLMVESGNGDVKIHHGLIFRLSVHILELVDVLSILLQRRVTKEQEYYGNGLIAIPE